MRRQHRTAGTWLVGLLNRSGREPRRAAVVLEPLPGGRSTLCSASHGPRSGYRLGPNEGCDPDAAEPVGVLLVAPPATVDELVPELAVGHRPDDVAALLFAHRELPGLRRLGRHHSHAGEALLVHLGQ